MNEHDFGNLLVESAGEMAQGADLREDGVHYRIWAPKVERLELEIRRGNGATERCEMTCDEFGFHSWHDENGRAGDRYFYHLDGGSAFPDPASRWQPEGVHGPSMVIDSRAYQWQCAAFTRPAFRDLVIYELHVGTFTPAGTFRAVIERLPHLQSLGINAIEIMPIADFAGDRNWGYDGVSLYATARVYGHPDDLRALIDAAHAAGLAVILDVVFNHFGPDGNYLAAYIGEYLDEAAKTPWGGAIRYGSPEFRPLRAFVVNNLHYWMEEFRIDGFRLDATHAIVDESPVHLLAEATEYIHSRGGYAIAEDSRNDAQVLDPVSASGLGFDALWADDFHHVVRVATSGEREAYLADFHGTLGELQETLERGWYYAGQYSEFLRQPRGTPGDGLRPGSCLHCISNHDQVGNRAVGERLSHVVSPESYRAASALICLTPHTPMLFMGQEWAASAPFQFFTDHNEELGKLITIGRREEFKDFAAFREPGGIQQVPDPQSPRTFETSRLDWSEVARDPHRGTLELYRACLALRQSNAAFRPTDASQWWVRTLNHGICALGLTAGKSAWLLLIDLTGDHLSDMRGLPFDDLSPACWRRVLSTRELRFGGDGSSALADDFTAVDFSFPEVIVLEKIAAP